MCGICGIHDPRGVSPDEIGAMMRALAHRGPDDQGLHAGRTVGLGHRRLSIIDLATGRQPMRSADGRLTVVFNGEIYNHRDLRARLEPRHRFLTTSDTEVLLHLYAERGADCVKELRGMFAFAVHDASDDTLFLARDHLGQKPLYYCKVGERFCFASEIKALLELDPGLREVDGEALCQYLALRFVAPPRSMFRRIRKLPPAHVLTYRGGEPRAERYWDLRFEPKLDLDLPQAVDELDRRLRAAVEYHLVSDVPVGAFLSGGVDSSLIVAMMRGITGRPFKTFTGDLPYGRHSELPYARLVSRRFGTENHELTITPSLVRDLPRVIWHLDEPSDPLSVCLYSLSGLIRREVKVVLGGDGGDELFAGYDRYYGYRYAGYLALLPRGLRERVLRRLLARLPSGSWYRSLGHQLQWILEMSLHDGSERYAGSLGYFYFAEPRRRQLLTPEFRRAVASFDPQESIRRHFDALDARDPLDRMLYADSATRLPDHPVMVLDRMTMAHGLEARSPFLDHEMAEFCARLPGRFKVRGTRRRVIQTMLARRYLPREVLTRAKQGFASPLPYMMQGEFRLLYRAFLRRGWLADDGYLDGSAVGSLLAEHESGRADHGSRLWLLCNSELWYRMFLRGCSPDAVRDQIRDALARGTAGARGGPDDGSSRGRGDGNGARA